MPASKEPLLSLRGAIGYGRRPLLENLALDIRPGEFWGIVGPNGAGKSTLLRTLLGTLRPVAGQVERRPGLKIGYVPQRSEQDRLFPLSAREVVELGGLGRGAWRVAPRRDVDLCLERLGIADLARRNFRALSGGQKQRVLMARALVRRPDLLVLDEPTAGLDLPGERDLLDFTSLLNKTEGTTILLVVHNLQTVLSRASHLAVLDASAGQFGTGEAAELATSARLTALYGRPMEVQDVLGERHVRAGAHP